MKKSLAERLHQQYMAVCIASMGKVKGTTHCESMYWNIPSLMAKLDAELVRINAHTPGGLTAHDLNCICQGYEDPRSEPYQGIDGFSDMAEVLNEIYGE